MGPLRCNRSTAAILVAAVRRLYVGLIGKPNRTMTMVSLAKAARMRRCSRGRERQRGQRPGKRENQEENGGTALQVGPQVEPQVKPA